MCTRMLTIVLFARVSSRNYPNVTNTRMGKGNDGMFTKQ